MSAAFSFAEFQEEQIDESEEDGCHAKSGKFGLTVRCLRGGNLEPGEHESLPIPMTIPTIAPLLSRAARGAEGLLELVGVLVSTGTTVPFDAVRVGRGTSLSCEKYGSVRLGGNVMVEGPVAPTTGVAVGREVPSPPLAVCGNDMKVRVRLSVEGGPRVVETPGGVGRMDREFHSSSESVSGSESESPSEWLS